MVVLAGTALVGAAVALLYHIFETALHSSINAIWYNWLNTDNNRWLVIPASVVIGLIFFGLQHFLDESSEKREAHGLGQTPPASVINLTKVLLIGFFSLLAGATLGPEAILVPASMILGGLLGKLLFRQNNQLTKLLAAAGIMALFTAFFKSIPIGIASLYLVTQQSKTKITPILVICAAITSTASYYVLKALDGSAYVQLPSSSWHLNAETLILGIGLILLGVLAAMAMYGVTQITERLKLALPKKWYAHAIIASLVIAILYLLGGPLVEFTGNLSIVPLFNQAAQLGVWGIIGIIGVKVILIGWSKAIGYRGGMIFPTIFVASALVAIMHLYVPSINIYYGIIAVLIGAFAANKKTHILV